MKYPISCILLIFCIQFLGCIPDTQSELQNQIADIKNDFRILCEQLLNDQVNLGLVSQNANEKFNSLQNDKIRSECIYDCTKILQQLDITKIPLDASPGHFGRCYGGMRELFEHILGFQSSSKEEQWNLKLQYLQWSRIQVSKMNNVPSYPKGVSRHINSFGYEDWKVDSGSRQVFMDYWTKLGRYNSYSNEYEADLRNRESLFLRDIEYFSIDVKQRLTAQFETFLGRKIRTRSQLLEDFRTRRRLEFPYLLPTTKGLQKIWYTPDPRKNNRPTLTLPSKLPHANNPPNN